MIMFFNIQVHVAIVTTLTLTQLAFPFSNLQTVIKHGSKYPVLLKTYFLHYPLIKRSCIVCFLFI
jgi:hypothetical protein